MSNEVGMFDAVLGLQVDLAWNGYQERFVKVQVASMPTQHLLIGLYKYGAGNLYPIKFQGVEIGPWPTLLILKQQVLPQASQL